MAAGLRCGSTTIKYLLFFFNFLFTLFGLAIVALGSVVLARMLRGGNTFDNTVIFIIVVGASIFFVAFMGCCGAVRESHCMLVLFACLLLTLIVCEVIAAVLVFVSVGSIDGTVDEVFRAAKNGVSDSDKAALELVNDLQASLKCCGVNNPTYWTSGTSNTLPDSCCSSKASCTLSSDDCYKTGCKSIFQDTMRKYSKAIGAVAIAIAVVEVVGVWFALALAGEIKRLSR